MLLVRKDITIEELITNIPESVSYLMKKGIKCLACGEPIWGTLESSAKEKGFDNTDIEKIVNYLNSLRTERPNH